jgi:maltose alpha-D-glucosyltransferase/alpha-amylase
MVQQHITHQGSGWEYTVNELRRYYERIAAQTPPIEAAAQPAPPDFFVAIQRWYLHSAGVLGRRTGELHLALAAATEPAFAPEPFTPQTLEGLAAGMRTHAAAALDLLESRLASLQESVLPQALTLLEGRHALLGYFDQLPALDAAGSRIRIHGDYHLGQVLRVEEDFFILDFEGEPARPLAERRAKGSPLKDVAGMVRSFSYAAYAALFSFTLHAPDDYRVLEQWAAAWHGWVADAFLQEYRAAVGDSPLVPSGDGFDALLRAFTIDKALYELAYELNNRPDWVRIPLAGLLKLNP